MLRFDPERGRKQIHIMRILQVGPIPPDVGGRTRGGVATHVWSLANHLATQSHQVAVFADNYVSRHSRSEFKDAVEIYGRQRPLRTLQTNQLSRFTFWKIALLTKSHFSSVQSWSEVILKSLDYYRVIALFQPDVIHVHHLENRFPYVHFLTNGRFPTVTTVHSTHSLEVVDSKRSDLQHQFVERNLTLAPPLIFVGHFVKKRYLELFSHRLETIRTWVIQNPVDISKYHPVPQEKARQHIHKESNLPLILFVGGLIPRKGPKLLIDSATRLKAKGLTFHLMIVGEGPQKRELQEMIQERDLRSYVSLEGPKSQAELPYYYGAADIFVLPSSSEGFALVFVEAMSCGCPIIGTQGVVDELISSEDYGFTAPLNDANSLSQVIEKALHRSWNRERIRNYALQFDWTVKVREFEQVYQTLKGIPVDSHTFSPKLGGDGR